MVEGFGWAVVAKDEDMVIWRRRIRKLRLFLFRNYELIASNVCFILQLYDVGMCGGQFVDGCHVEFFWRACCDRLKDY